MHLTPDSSRSALATLIDPVADLSQSCVQTHRKGILAGHLHSVVLRRIVRCRDLHRSLESVKRRSEIHHRSGAQACVIYIGTGIGDSLQKIFMNLRGRGPGIPADQHLVGRKKFRKEIAHLVGHVLVEIHIVDSSNVVSVKCSHNYLFDLYRVCTEPLEMASSLRAIILRRIGETLSTKRLPSR